MGQRLNLTSELKPIGVGAAKASLNRAIESLGLDPKPSDLPMARVKVVERRLEARTGGR